jgi:hypothetical protein
MESERIRAQLDRILASAAFADAERASRFLRFVVERALEGHTSEIKESVIAVEVGSLLCTARGYGHIRRGALWDRSVANSSWV